MKIRSLLFIFSLAFPFLLVKVNATDLMLNPSGTPSINHPFRAFENYRNRMLEMFQDFDSEFNGQMGFNSFNPEINIETRGDSYIVTVDLPGSDEEKINVELENEVLKITIGRLGGEWL